MGFGKINAQGGLLIIVPVVLGLLVYGLYTWPSGVDAQELMSRNQEIKDSINQVELSQEKLKNEN